MYLIVAEEKQSSIIHQLSGFSVFRLWHVPGKSSNSILTIIIIIEAQQQTQIKVPNRQEEQVIS